MKSLERLLKIVTSLAAIAAAVMAFFYFFQSKKERIDELNEYLMGDEDEKTAIDSEDGPEQYSDVEYLEHDMCCLDQLDANQSAELAFLVDPDYLSAFQNTLADAGYSSEYNPDSQMLNMLLSGPTDSQEVAGLSKLLSELITSTHSTYLGFALQ